MKLRKLSFILPVLSFTACDVPSSSDEAAELVNLGKADVSDGAKTDPSTDDACTSEEYLSLTPVDAAPLEPAREAYNADCGNGYEWCDVDSVDAWTLPACPETASFDAILELLRSTHVAFEGQHQGAYAEFVTREELKYAVPFSAYYSDAGPAFLEALDAFAGSDVVEGWTLSYDLPCHNCTDAADVVLVYYPSTGFVFVLQGNHGYDS